ncbi:MAG: sugar phosphate isomerase/epimerase [Clostridia bacterium]|nr:sugar phosphate isomerase/epimerase [Clostridia bacterium]
MKISAYLNSPQKLFGLERAYAILAEIGYDCVDSPFPHFDTRKPLDNTKYGCPLAELEAKARVELAAAKAVGMTIGQTHAPFPTYHPDPSTFRTLVECQKKALYATALLEAPYMVLHAAMPNAWHADTYPDYSRSLNYALLEELLPVAHRYGVKIALENMPGAKCTTGTTEVLVDYIDMMDSPDLCACFDTGHSLLSGEQIGDSVRLLGKRLEVLHVHDNNGVNGDKRLQPVLLDQHLPPMMGKQDWDAFGQALADIGYTGSFSYESILRMPADYYPVVERMQFAFAQALIAKYGL